MKWKTPAKEKPPKKFQRRLVIRFALFPIPCSDGQTYWLTKIVDEEVFNPRGENVPYFVGDWMTVKNHPMSKLSELQECIKRAPIAPGIWPRPDFPPPPPKAGR